MNSTVINRESVPIQKHLLAIFLIVLYMPVLLTSCANRNSLRFTHSANGSRASYWSYELSTDQVLKEVDYEKSRSRLCFGPGYTQIWKFKSIGEGEVTIHWMEHLPGGKIEEEYFITYQVDEDGSISIISITK